MHTSGTVNNYNLKGIKLVCQMAFLKVHIRWIIILTNSFSLFVLLQILNPNPDAMSKMITENASEEFLHSLSNYCALQVWTDP